MFCLCLTTGRHLGFTGKLWNSRSRGLCTNSSCGNAAGPFRYRRSFMNAAVSDISYIAESIDTKTVGVQYPAIAQY